MLAEQGLGFKLLLTNCALVAAPAQAMATVQVKPHVVFPLSVVAAKLAAEAQGQLFGVSQHDVWRGEMSVFINNKLEN